MQREAHLQVVRSTEPATPRAAGPYARRWWRYGSLLLPALSLLVVGGVLEANGHVRTGACAAVVGIVTSLLSLGVHRPMRSHG